MIFMRALALCLCAALPLAAQNAVRVDPATGHLGRVTNPYRTRFVPPVGSSNTSRLESLIRAGNLYVSAEDVVALAIENNIDIEIQRYGPLLAKEVLGRAQGGGALRSVGLPVSPGPQGMTVQTGSSGASDALSGSSGGAGGSGTGQINFTAGSGGGSGSTGYGFGSGGGGRQSLLSQGSASQSSGAAGNTGSATGFVPSLGPSIPSFDPVLSLSTVFSHSSTPQSNTILVGTTTLVEQLRTYQGQITQNWDFGLSGQLSYTSQYTRVNSSFYDVNPFTTAGLDLQITQNLLQGFGRAVNGRNIRIQKNNIKVSDFQFRQQVIVTVASALNLYWDFVSFHDDVVAKRRETETAQLLLQNNREQVAIGALPKVEVTRAEAQLYASQADLLVSETNLRQQETILKNILSRNGVAGPVLAGVHIIPLDSIPPPGNDPPPDTEALIGEAVANRVEVAEDRLNLDSSRLNLVGVENGLKPVLQVFIDLTNNALTGALTTHGVADNISRNLVGGYGTLLAQIARHDFPGYAAGIVLSFPFRNRAAQSDYVTSLLEMRQNELSLQKTILQIRVDVENALTGLRQARARYDAALKARDLEQETVDEDQKRLDVKASTTYEVVQDQRDLASAASMLTQATAAYVHARILVDQVVGRTLEVNHISIEEAVSGHMSRQSSLPAQLPEGGTQ
jgi:outer membrane protein